MRNLWLSVVIATLLFFSSVPVQADTNSFLEQFALAPNRDVPLKQLIPGTRDYYYYQALHLQNQGKLAQVEALLKRWKLRYRHDSRRTEIKNRQALFRYNTNPKASLAYLIKQLNVRLQHSRSVAEEKRQYPSKLDGSKYTQATLGQRELTSDSDNLYTFTDDSLFWLAQQKLNGEQRRTLLKRLTYPAIPGLVSLVHEDLQYKYSGGFGSLPIHHKLTLSQLDALQKRNPSLLKDSKFVHTYLRKLRPKPDQDWRRVPALREAYLARLWQFVQTLGPGFNSLKLNVLYYQLKLKLRQGQYDQQKFISYIQLPRYASYSNKAYVQEQPSRSHVGNLYARYRSITGLPRIGNDEPLVRQYLMHFFQQADSYQSYATYLKDSYLKRVFAETKLLYGIGDAEKWFDWLSATALKSLKDRVVLRFAPGSKRTFQANQKVSLQLDVKNVETLLVKVYIINARNLYRKKGQKIRADLNLDGLVPHKEKVYHYKTPPLRQVRRTFDFPTLTQRGIYIVDFIGNGKNSRAMIHKGQFRFLQRMSVAGHVLTILDETGQKAPNAYVWQANRTYQADKDGTITLPFTRKPGWKKIILGSGDFVSLARIYQRQEAYQFNASFYVDRESLLARKHATVLIRPRLRIHGVAAPLKLLEEVALEMTAVDHFGVQTRRKVNEFKLYENKESTYRFRVPANLSRLSFRLTARIKKVSDNKTVTLQAAQSFTVNQIDRSARLASFHLVQINGQYAIDLLDRTGRTWANRVVHLSLKHRGFRYNQETTLQTDDNGRIELGQLPEITWIKAKTADGISRQWSLSEAQNTLPTVLQAQAGQTLSLPYPGQANKPSRAEFSLLEKRHGMYVADHFAALAIQPGLLLIEKLPAGDYELRYHRQNHIVTIRVTQGHKVGDFVVGSYRTLQATNSKPLQITSIQADNETVKVQLVNASPWARVHIIATRYVPEFHPFSHLHLSGSNNPSHSRWSPRSSTYLVGRSIGEEYRYILDRKYAKKYPGNMLRRPSLLLNPWAIRKTHTSRQTTQPGGTFEKPAEDSAGDGTPYRRDKSNEQDAPTSAEQASPNLDFLPKTSVVLTNLKADKDGLVQIKRSTLQGHTLVHVVAVDPEHTAYKRVSLTETPLQPKDLRLRANLPARKHFTQQSQIAALRAGQTFQLKDVTTSQFEVIDSLDKAYTLLSTLSRDENLQTFQFILRWPRMSAAEKRKMYSKHACHELHFFLYRKDPKFFQQVVLPYLKNKKDKTFLDHWLLGADLTQYLRPWAYQQLNIVERILLAQRVVDEKSRTSRHVRELFEMLRPNLQLQRAQFETALKLSALHTKGRLLALQKLMERARRDKDREATITDEEQKPRPKPEKKIRLRGVFIQGRKPPLQPKLDNNKDSTGEGEYKKKFKQLQQDMSKRQQYLQLYQPLEKTKEWVENNYYHLPIHQQDASLVKVNAFWNDYANHDGTSRFISQHLSQASRNFTEMMFALSVLDLPFQSPDHKTDLKKLQLRLTAKSDLLVYYKAIQEATVPKARTSILVSQDFYEYGRKYRYIRGRRVERYVTGEFLARKVYGCQVVVTNPTGTRQKLELLVQIPQGALPVLNGRYTHRRNIDLGAYRTQRFNYYFYFPKAGSYQHFPVHVSQDGKLLAFATPRPAKVVNKPSVVDKTSWDYVSQQGSLQDVLAYLSTHNLQRTPLHRIAWRMKDADAYRRIIAWLRQHHAYHQTLWGYGFQHNDVTAIQDYLQHRTGFLYKVGMTITSPLLKLDPVAHKTYQHMEYKPLVNARTHPLANKPRIVNNRLAAQYKRFLKLLTYRRKLTEADKLAATYYLLLQDRIAEAIGFFARVRSATIATQLQYDYCKVYLLFYQGVLQEARAIAEKYKSYPVLRWRQRFANALQQLDEIEGKSQQPQVVDPKHREQQQTRQASREASFHFKLKDKQIVLTHRNISKFRIHYYKMDIELLFSHSPFVQKHSEQFSYIRPNLLQDVKASAGKTTIVDLPRQFHHSNVMIEITAAGQQRAQAYYANSLDVQVTPHYGQLRVVSDKAHQALPKVYVKVYARLHNGAVLFYKDGYTDLRGRFDYTSLNTNTLDKVKRFSLLVLSPQHGATVLETAPPKQ